MNERLNMLYLLLSCLLGQPPGCAAPMSLRKIWVTPPGRPWSHAPQDEAERTSICTRQLHPSPPLHTPANIRK